nr:probable apyrase 6 isoform X1 [Ipomoea trifida]
MRRSNARTASNSTDEVIKDEYREMDTVKLQFRPPRSAFRSPARNSQKSKLIFYVSVVLFLAFFCYIFVFSKNIRARYAVKTNYGIVIDGGSTGTRIHVFEYEVRNGMPLFDFGEKGLHSMKVNPGLSAYAEEPEKAASAIAELVEFAKKKVPRKFWGKTKIRLMATAGMRLLESKVQKRILNVCRKVLRGSGFIFRDDWASVISGSDEGAYAWVVANYALGTLGGNPKQTTGIIELGGASAQVTFVSSEPFPPEYSTKIKFGNHTYSLYSHSLLHFGQNVAFDSLRESLAARGNDLAIDSLQSAPMDPCTPRGYARDTEPWKFSPSYSAEKSRYLSTLNPIGNFTECRSASLSLLQKGKEKCPHKSCDIGSAFIPKLQGKFLATENFFHTSKFFGLSPKSFLSDLMVAGKRFCEEDWSKLRTEYHSLAEEDMLHYCFSSAYIVALLHDSLGIALDDERIGYANQVKNVPLDWALGAFILQSNSDLEEGSSNWFAFMFGDDLSISILVLGISILLIFVTLYVRKWRNPQLKTVYDLEKGKYIVKRVARYS